MYKKCFLLAIIFFTCTGLTHASVFDSLLERIGFGSFQEQRLLPIYFGSTNTFFFNRTASPAFTTSSTTVTKIKSDTTKNQVTTRNIPEGVLSNLLRGLDTTKTKQFTEALSFESGVVNLTEEQRRSVGNPCSSFLKEEQNNCHNSNIQNCISSSYLNEESIPEAAICKFYKPQIDSYKVNIKTASEMEPDDILAINPDTSKPRIYDDILQPMEAIPDFTTAEAIPERQEFEIRQNQISDVLTNVNEFSYNDLNTRATSTFEKDKWIAGKATVYGISPSECKPNPAWGATSVPGCKLDGSGRISQMVTAFQYDVADADVCVISLPYRIVDTFFGTNFLENVANKNVRSILSEKKLVQGRALEIQNLQNGKRELVGLGDFGPNDKILLRDNKIADLPRCVANKLGINFGVSPNGNGFGGANVKIRPAPANI